jgi:hypothetical protein
MFRASGLLSVFGPVEYIIPGHDFRRECLGVRAFRISSLSIYSTISLLATRHMAERPSYTVKDASIELSLPARWTFNAVGVRTYTILLSVQRRHNIVVQFSRHQYQHLATMHHSLYPDSKTLLRSTWGKENIKMRDYYNPALRSAMMEAHDEAATMKLDFFYSTNRVSLPNIPTLQNPNNQCSKLQVVLVRRLLSFKISNIEIPSSNNRDRQISQLAPHNCRGDS